MALQVLAILWIAKYDLQVSASEGRGGDSEKLCSVSMAYWGSAGDQSKILPYKHSRVHARAHKRSFSISTTTGIASCWQLPVSSHPISAGGRPERENQYSRRSKTYVLRVKNLLGLTGGICGINNNICRNKQQQL